VQGHVHSVVEVGQGEGERGLEGHPAEGASGVSAGLLHQGDLDGGGEGVDCSPAGAKGV